MNLHEKVSLNTKNTIGYIEACDKESFLTGVKVATSLMCDEHEKVINDLHKTMSYYKSEYKKLSKDLTTISRILHIHSPHED
jgi:hypothetical protein